MKTGFYIPSSTTAFAFRMYNCRLVATCINYMEPTDFWDVCRHDKKNSFFSKNCRLDKKHGDNVATVEKRRLTP